LIRKVTQKTVYNVFIDFEWSFWATFLVQFSLTVVKQECAWGLFLPRYREASFAADSSLDRARATNDENRYIYVSEFIRRDYETSVQVVALLATRESNDLLI